ncbi:CYTH and CHAD domain-containing protein [Streptomyces sp. NBC_00091]|uniref:CYTH and CHAD domain-containing protein n=1 Tax=Streptomyces sp. NBC_00091 TaxID=2975648 RepID=UPI00225946DD|nr:CYTH and CHAD domain-containing protein [Streptomyces sp. NBC_00091]MCX5378371.1 CYTH and CHAD domain-containing protein [Streptomyces sp. NBC_00091]
MAETQREIERKFEFTQAGPGQRLPDLTGTAAIAAVRDRGTVHLDAVYYDTPDRRLAADGLTLRRRTGGEDAGWHLKLPVAPGVRDEIRTPLADTVPPALARLVRSRVRDASLEPQVRLLSSRKVSHLLDARGTLLAELSTDEVTAEREDTAVSWTEVEVELADGADPALLDAVEKTFRKAGLKVSDAPSKLARALAETGAEPPARPGPGPDDETAGAHVLAYLRDQVDALISYDPAVRRDLPDSVHQMRVAARRMRSAFKSYRKVLDREITDPIGEELRWLAGELGVDRDQEVLHDRFQAAVAELPRTLLTGPVRSRLRTWNGSRRAGSRRRALAALDNDRHLALIDTLEGLLADPPLLSGAAKPAGKALPKAVRRDYGRLAARVDHSLSLDPGEDRDHALHDARKAAKRARYAAEAAKPALGKSAEKLAKAMKSVQTLLGEHQDSVVARTALRDLARQAHGAGEPSFTWGLLYGHEEALAERCERDLPDVWAKASAPGRRAALG